MSDVVHNYDKTNTTHVLFDVDEDHYNPTFLVPPGMVMCGRPGGGDPWENRETVAMHCGARDWSTVYDPHFGFPIGRKLSVVVRAGPIGNAYEGHVSGSIQLWYKPLSVEYMSLQSDIPEITP